MDVYMLARMFKKFNVSGSYDPEYAKNIIVYAGAAHVLFYRQFLLSNGFIEKYNKQYTKKSKRSCLDLSDMPQPLFAK